MDCDQVPAFHRILLPELQNFRHYRKMNHMLSSFLCRLIYFLILIRLSSLSFCMKGHMGSKYFEILHVWKLLGSVFTFGWYFDHILFKILIPQNSEGITSSMATGRRSDSQSLICNSLLFWKLLGFIIMCFDLGPFYSNSLCWVIIGPFHSGSPCSSDLGYFLELFL